MQAISTVMIADIQVRVLEGSAIVRVAPTAGTDERRGSNVFTMMFNKVVTDAKAVTSNKPMTVIFLPVCDTTNAIAEAPADIKPENILPRPSNAGTAIFMPPSMYYLFE
jgi:hypothetical protein